MKLENNNIWITSDSHYNHTNICRGVTGWKMPDGSIPINQTRDFPTLEKMNDAIVNGINGVVGQDDILIHGGDWSLGGFESIREFMDRLICKNIYLYHGNHDHHQKKNKHGIRELFLLVDKSEDELFIDKKHIHIQHYPLQSWNDMKRGTIHLHGHSHFTGDDRLGKGKKMDIGMDGHPEFRPYNLRTEVFPLMDKRPVTSEYDTVLDHHVDDTRYNR